LLKSLPLLFHLGVGHGQCTVCRSCYYQLRQLRSVARSLSAEAVKAVVHAFISSRLDYCNSLLTGVNEGLLRRLQSAQNAAARLVTGTRRCEHITPALRQLHWLPVGNWSSISRLPGQLVAVSGRGSLRSAERRVCHVPHQNSTFGDRSFSVAGPRTWNELPLSPHDTGLSLTTFNEHLKTHLFSVAFW